MKIWGFTISFATYQPGKLFKGLYEHTSDFDKYSSRKLLVSGSHSCRCVEKLKATRLHQLLLL